VQRRCFGTLQQNAAELKEPWMRGDHIDEVDRRRRLLRTHYNDVDFHKGATIAKVRLARGTPYHAHSVSRLAVKSRGQTLFLKASEIDWIEAANYYACLHLGRATHIVRRTIQELEQDLHARTFFRIHRSIIVNLERVRGSSCTKTVSTRSCWTPRFVSN
jgi:DNA-binding LytR/AlgR family response regulator